MYSSKRANVLPSDLTALKMKNPLVPRGDSEPGKKHNFFGVFAVSFRESVDVFLVGG